MRDSLGNKGLNSSDIDGFVTNDLTRDKYKFHERYCGCDIRRFRVGANKELVYSKLRREAQIFPTPVVNLLENCRSLRTLDEHARSYCHEGITPLEGDPHNRDSRRSFDMANGNIHDTWPDDPEISNQNQGEPLINTLLSLADGGWLISEDEMRKLDGPVSRESKTSPRISSVGVVTRDRVKSLRRGLISYINNGKKYGRDNDFVVVDDSDSATVAQYTKHTLLALKLLHDVKIAYAGRKDKIQFAKSLIKHGDLPKEVVYFALFGAEGCGCTIGANRNALLLHTAGDAFFSVDDDTLCQIAPAPDFREGVKYDPTRNFLSYWFYPNQQETVRSVADVDKDVLAIHEQMLGRDINDCVSSPVEAGADDQAISNARRVSTLLPGQGKILLTFMGVYGDAGMYSPIPYFWMNQESTLRLAQSGDSPWFSRELFRVAPQASITGNTRGCLASAMGCDNRDLLPPFVPVMRGEDALFGLMLRACFANAYIGHLPWGIHHSPLQPRSFSAEDIWKVAARARFCDVIAVCVKSFLRSPKFVEDVERLRLLGKHLISIGSLPLTEFEEFIRLSLWEQKSREIAYLENNLPNTQQLSSVIGGNISYYLDTLQESLAKDEYIVPDELLAAYAPDEARRLTRQIVLKFGHLLSWWPEIVETAKRLREQGCRLAPSL